MRGRLFAPKPAFDDFDALNDWLRLRCEELAKRPHPEQSDRTIAELFEDERAELRPLGRAFDGYVEKTVRVRSTCLVQYASNRYSVPSRFAGQHVSLRAYAGRIVLVSGQDVIAEHKRRFTRNVSYFEPWHYVPLLDRKPGALRDEQRKEQTFAAGASANHHRTEGVRNEAAVTPNETNVRFVCFAKAAKNCRDNFTVKISDSGDAPKSRN